MERQKRSEKPKGKSKRDDFIVEDEEEEFDEIEEDPIHEKYLLYKILNLEKGADINAIVS